MRLPPLEEFPPCISNRDLHRLLEAMRAGLRSDPPDAFTEDWEETLEEIDRLLVEIETEPPPD